MTSTGSLINNLISGPPARDPEVGDGATICHWSDRSPATVTEVLRFKSGAKKGEIRGVRIRPDHVKLTSGSEQDGSARYDITPQELTDPPLGVVYLRNKNTGQYNRLGTPLALGHRERYYDPSF